MYNLINKAFIVFFAGILMLALLVGCKKETVGPQSTQSSGPFVEDPPYEITVSDFNYPVGKRWVYFINMSTSMANFDNPTDPNSNYTHTSSDTYTVMVVSDSVDGALHYCNYKYFLSNGQSGIVQSNYTDTINNNYHQIIDGVIGADVFGPAALSIHLPLRDTSTWNNLYYPSMSNINECRGLGFENLYSPLYLKCLKWEMVHYPGDENWKTYWYHKKHGMVKYIGENLQQDNNGNLVTLKTTTISLTHVN